MASAAPERHRFSVEEYHRMATAGLFGEDDRVELIDGEIIDMAPIGSRHAACVDRLSEISPNRSPTSPCWSVGATSTPAPGNADGIPADSRLVGCRHESRS